MEAVASIVSVVAVSLGAVRTLYETFIGIQDGPQAVLRFLTALTALQPILKHLYQIATQRSSDRHHEVESVWQPLEEQTRRCSEDLQRMHANSSFLVDSSREYAMRRAWRRVKIMLKERIFKGCGIRFITMYLY